MVENGLVRLKLISFNKQETDNLNSILTLASRALTKKWQIVGTAAEADFFLLSATATTTHSDAIVKSQQAERCLFCTTHAENTPKNSLLVDEKHVPSLKSLVTLFNQLSANLTEHSNAPAPALSTLTSAPAATSSDTFFDPKKGLLSYLLATEPLQWIISLSKHPDYAPLYLDIEKGIYYSRNSLEQLNPYLINSVSLSIIQCSTSDINAYIASENLKACELKSLIWYVVMQTSTGRTLKNHATTDIIALKSWPDLKMYRCIDYAKVITFMRNNAAPLDFIALETGMPMEKMNDFYNACYLAGLIEIRDKVEINKKTISTERLELLNKIDARLK